MEVFNLLLFGMLHTVLIAVGSSTCIFISSSLTAPVPWATKCGTIIPICICVSYKLHKLATVACSYRTALRVNSSLGVGWLGVFLAFFKLIRFLLPDSPPVALNDALAATSYEHMLSECMHMIERYDCGLHC